MHDDRFSRDDLAAWACIRLDRLAHGYRILHLFDRKGVYSKGILLVKISYDWKMKRAITFPTPSQNADAAHAKSEEPSTKPKATGLFGKAKEKAHEELDKHTSEQEKAKIQSLQSKLSLRQH